VPRLALEQRSSVEALLGIPVATASGPQPLARFVSVDSTVRELSRHRKNLRPVIYVTADVADAVESPVYAILAMNRALDSVRVEGAEIVRYNAVQPERLDEVAMKWDGEWQVTIEVFRDLGLAFAVVLVLIYVLVVGWFQSFTVPLVIMAPIPLTLIGILPGHALTGAFFTATSMIGMIALAGIIVRNSILRAPSRRASSCARFIPRSSPGASPAPSRCSRRPRLRAYQRPFTSGFSVASGSFRTR
jgi:multidrug efflux pump subunit AcrB